MRRSIGWPLGLGIALVIVAGGLGVGWQILVVGDLGPVARGLTGLHWALIALGSAFSALLIAGLLLLCIWLVQEIRFNQRQQAFLDAVTHELKTPLASLRLYVDTLRRHDPPAARRGQFLDRMGGEIVRLERTVGQVLATARAESRTPPRLGRIELAALLERCVEELRGRHGLPAVSFRLAVPPGCAVRGDPEELGLVFRNLLENAIKYSEDPIEVRVAAHADAAGRVRIEIADRGIGIEPEELRKIFQRFYRAGRDVQRQAVGLGLGLFIVRNLVRRQGGQVEARSEGQGRGSRFLVTLRAAGAAQEPARAASAPRADAVGSAP